MKRLKHDKHLKGFKHFRHSDFDNEEKYTIRDLMDDLEIVVRKMNHHRIERGMILRNEKANDTYNTDFLNALYCEEGKGK